MKNTLRFSMCSILILFLGFVSTAQRGALVIKDVEGNPLAGVYVRDMNNPSLVGVTDYGKFDIRGTDFTTDILLQRFGYNDQIVDVDLRNPNNITMIRKTLPDDLVYLNTVDELDPGFRTNEYEVFGNFNTQTVNGVTDQTTGDGQTRVFIDDSEDAFGNGSSLRVMYPRGKVDSKDSGVQWRGDLHSEHTELYVSYWVKFENGFDFTLGGKLPGLAGSENISTNDNEFSGKLMWRENGKLEFYLHPTSSGVDGSSDSDAGKIRGWWDQGGQVRLRKGQWEYIEIYYKLNTPGSANGTMKGWINGVQRGQKNNVEFRGAGESNVKLNQLFFSTFFGGNQSYAPMSNQYAWFDDFRVSTNRIGTTTQVITSLENNQIESLEKVTKIGSDLYTFNVPTQWVIMNTMGQIVGQGNGEQVNLSQYSPGQYFLKYLDGTYKMIKL